MSNEMITQLPTVTNSLMSDIIYAVQGYVSPASPGTSVQETLQQVFNLMLSNTILNNAGNPNGAVAGVVFQFCWDTTDTELWVCTTSGSISTAVWTLVAAGSSSTITPTRGGTGVSSPTAHTLPVAEGASNFNFLGPLTNGQLLIGSTGADPVPTTLTAGSNISIINSAGGITIATSGSAGFSWSNVTGPSQTLASNNGYVANRVAGTVVFTLPATSTIGDEIDIVGAQNGWSISQGAGQSIHLGSSTTTVGVGGSLASTNANDSLILICTGTNTTWTAISVIGNLTVV